ncbi:MAG: FG-GAP-like repeat-containing protein, partial [Methanolobus sp.]|nr:FG-GAP-like repeat-containing protein [Methanolobus sp.]
AAKYQIPIHIPAGVNGIQPYLSVIYDSQAENGLLGYRCNLSAFSAITRTGKTYYHDGNATAPDLTTSDNLLLNGQRLMRTSGSNLITGAKYATETESYSEIIYKTINSLPAFEVKTKDGLVLEFGATTNSNIEAQGTSTTLIWLLNKSTDINGNYILYDYEKDSNTKEFRLKNIEYTGNVNHSPTCKIEFFYETRSDTIISYVSGKKQQSTVILNKIRTSVSDNKIKEYKFNYFYDGYYTKLTEITEFGIDNTHFNSTKIDWGDFIGESSRYANEDLAFLSTPREGYFPVFTDFTGDGKTDFLSFPTKPYYNQFDSISLYVSNSTWGSINFNKKNSIPYFQHLVADLDGNGTIDLITKQPTGNSGYWIYDFYSYNGNHLVSTGKGFEAIGGEALTGDFNGDGKDEILVKNTQDVYNENGIKIASGGIDNWGTNCIVRSLSSIHLIDFNGNGKTNILVMDGTSAWVYELNGTSFQKLTTFTTSEISTSFAVFPGDYNRDGKTDILAQDLSQNLSNLDNIFILFSTGTCFLKKDVTIPGFPEVGDELFVGDFNKDGKSDVLFFNKVIQGNDTLLNPVVGLFNGKNDFVIKEHYTSYIHASKFRRYNRESNFSISDFDGDGRDEFCIAAYSDACVISFFTDDQNLLVRNIIDGFGNTTSFDYSTVSEDATYTETGTIPVYPVVNCKIPLTVVKSLTQYTGGTLSSQYYNYKNLRLHKQGKGFLCFGEITATDFSKSQKSVTQYNYNATYFNPFITEQKVYTTSNMLLSTTIFNNSFLLTGTKRIFPYVSSQTQTDHLTSNTQTTTYSNWEYGNPKNISKTFSGSISESTSIIYQNTINSNVRITGLPTFVQINKVSNGQILEEKTITEYNTQFLPSKVTTYITPASKKTESRSFSYDIFGNVLTDSVRLYSSGNALVTTYEFSSDGRLPTRKTSPIGLSIDYQ